MNVNDTIRTKLCIQNVDRCCWWFQALSNWIQLVPWCAGTTTSCSGAPWPWFLHGVVMQSVPKPGWKGENQTHNQEKVLRILWVYGSMEFEVGRKVNVVNTWQHQNKWNDSDSMTAGAACSLRVPRSAFEDHLSRQSCSCQANVPVRSMPKGDTVVYQIG